MAGTTTAVVSRWALTWSEPHGYAEREYGVAEQRSRAKTTSADGVFCSGIIEAGRGKARILKSAALDEGRDPATETRINIWEMTQRLIRSLESTARPRTRAISRTASTWSASVGVAPRTHSRITDSCSRGLKSPASPVNSARRPPPRVRSQSTGRRSRA